MVTANLDKLAVIHTDAATRRAAMISSRAPWAPCHPAVATSPTGGKGFGGDQTTSPGSGSQESGRRDVIELPGGAMHVHRCPIPDRSPSAMFKRLSLTQRLLAGTALAVTLAFGILLAITVQQSRQSAVEQAELGMRTQLDLVVTMLDYAQDALKTRARDQLTLLEHELPGKASLGAPVATGKLELPRLRFGDLEGSNNPEFLEAYRKRNAVDAAFLVREGDTFYRASTLLKDADGKYRVGEVIKDSYVATLLRGETYTGTLERGGRLYVLGAKPVLGADGKVIGAITVRLDAEANVTMLKDRLRNIAVGSSGYLYVLAPPSGDTKESRVLMHPQHEGKRVSELDAETIRPELEKQLAERNGTHRYTWIDASGRQLEKIAMFKEQKELGWIVASSTAIGELTAASEALRNLLLGLSVGFGLLLCAGIGGYIWASLRRLQPVMQGIEALAAGDLGRQLPCDPESRHEADMMARALNEASAALRQLMGSVQTTVGGVEGNAAQLSALIRGVDAAMGQQSEATSGMSTATEELSTSIDQVAHNAAHALALTRDTRAAVDEGRMAVHDTIGAMENTAAKVADAADKVRDLGERGHKVQDIAGAIQSIADQTNLLALNAAIEAARAGEAGRGFAVVADEVRKLAERAKSSASDISAILASLLEQVGNVAADIVEASDRARDSATRSRQVEDALTAIEQRSTQTVDAVEDIARAADEQSRAGHDIARKVESVAHLAGTIGSQTREVEDVAGDLAAQVAGLSDAAARFRR